MAFPKGADFVSFCRRPEQVALARRHNEDGLRQARNRYGFIRFRVVPFYRADMEMYSGLRGEALMINVSEVVDYWALWGDLKRFLVAWRPRRLSSPAGQHAADRLLADWEKIANDLR